MKPLIHHVKVGGCTSALLHDHGLKILFKRITITHHAAFNTSGKPFYTLL